MIVNPRYAIERAWVFSNGNDIRQMDNFFIEINIDALFSYMNNDCYISKSNITPRLLMPTFSIPKRRSGELYWNLHNDTFQAICDVRLNLPSNIIAEIITHSNLLDNGLVIPTKTFTGTHNHLMFPIQSHVDNCQISIDATVGLLRFNEIEPQYVPPIR